MVNIVQRKQKGKKTTKTKKNVKKNVKKHKKIKNNPKNNKENDIENKTVEPFLPSIKIQPNPIEAKKIELSSITKNIIHKNDEGIINEEINNKKNKNDQIVINSNNSNYNLQKMNNNIINYFNTFNSMKSNYRPKGLENFNYNCYMNSLLQCFFYLKDFRKFFLEKNFQREQLMCQALKDVMNGLNIKDGKYFYSARKLKNEIKKDIIFKDGQGSDVTDLLDYIFNNIISENDRDISSEHTVEYQTQTDDKILMYKDLYNEINFNIIINNLFLGFYEKEFKCINNHLKYSFQSEYRIVFSLEEIFSYYKGKDNLTLYDCFEHYKKIQKTINEEEKKEEEEEQKVDESNSNGSFLKKSKEDSLKDSAEELLEDSDSSEKENQNENKSETFDKCQKCEEKYMLVEKIFRSPKYLIIILDRGYNKKCDKKVIFDEEIDLINYIDDEAYEWHTKYKLTGVCTHHGRSGNSGHYTSICLCDDNNYYYFSDSYSRPLKNKEELYEGSPYILFYSRLELTQMQKVINKNFFLFRSKIINLMSRIEKIKEFSVINQLEFNNLNYTITEKNEIFEKITTFQVDFTEFVHKSKKPKITIIKTFIERKKKEENEKKEKGTIFWDEDLLDEVNIKRIEHFIDSYFKEFKCYLIENNITVTKKKKSGCCCIL